MSDKISNILPYRKHSAGNAPKARRDRDAEQAFGADRSGMSARCRRRTGFFRARGKSRAGAVPDVAQARIPFADFRTWGCGMWINLLGRVRGSRSDSEDSGPDDWPS